MTNSHRTLSMSQAPTMAKPPTTTPGTGRETALYPPVRDYLRRQGYDVKGEIEHCDLVAVRGDEPPVIVELKVRLNLELLLQAADRLAITDSVYIAFPSSAPLWRRQWRRVRGLCRRLGLGILTLDDPPSKVTARLDPAPYRPRGSRPRSRRLLAEFEHRVGDPNLGGSTRRPLITAYRQDALRCATALAGGSLTVADLRAASGVERAAGILQKDHYGWFERVQRGVYRLSPKGRKVPTKYADAVRELGAGDS